MSEWNEGAMCFEWVPVGLALSACERGVLLCPPTRLITLPTCCHRHCFAEVPKIQFSAVRSHHTSFTQEGEQFAMAPPSTMQTMARTVVRVLHDAGVHFPASPILFREAASPRRNYSHAQQSTEESVALVQGCDRGIGLEFVS